MVKHSCFKQTEKERKMETILLTDETKITTIKECGEAYFTWHKKEADAKTNLSAIKTAIKENEAVAWFKHGISVERNKVNNNFDKDQAKEVITELCEKLNYSKKKTAKFIGRCTKKTEPFTKISKAK